MYTFLLKRCWERYCTFTFHHNKRVMWWKVKVETPRAKPRPNAYTPNTVTRTPTRTPVSFFLSGISLPPLPKNVTPVSLSYIEKSVERLKLVEHHGSFTFQRMCFRITTPVLLHQCERKSTTGFHLPSPVQFHSVHYFPHLYNLPYSFHPSSLRMSVLFVDV